MYELTQPTFVAPRRASLTILRTWCLRRKTRRHLRGLDARLLADVGLSEADRARECAKWFWQV
ncbi:MAG: DUF1127 domain-containing protein [Kiloniellales bacterium]|nr:DUF1127 domain-containing protein [Kiloniellales bacterium]